MKAMALDIITIYDGICVSVRSISTSRHGEVLETNQTFSA